MSCAGPDIEFESGRGVRTSPLYTRLQTHGAVFGQIIGFEPALYFDSSSVLQGRDLRLNCTGGKSVNSCRLAMKIL